MPKRESLWKQHPDYRVDLEPDPARVRARLGGEALAESDRTLRVHETGHAPVTYFPRDDVRFEHLEPTAHETFCPFKGEASYWTARAGGRTEANLAWSYEDPFDEVAGLAGYVAFYPDRVEWEREE